MTDSGLWTLLVWGPGKIGGCPTWLVDSTSDSETFETLLSRLMRWKEEGQSVRLEYCAKPIREEPAPIPVAPDAKSLAKRIECMVPGKKYHIQYKTADRRQTLEAVLEYAGKSDRSLLVSGAGTSKMPIEWIVSVDQVFDNAECYIGRRVFERS